MTDYTREWKNIKWGDMIKFSPAPRHRRNIICRKIKNWMCDKTSLHDVGCGNAWLLHQIQREFPHLQISGSDAAKSIIEYNRRSMPGIDFHHQDISLPLSASERYDIIVCSEVLEHIKNYRFAVSNLHRLLNKNGIVIITVPRGRIYPIDKFVGHIQHFDNARSFTLDGFELLEEEYWGFPFFTIYKWAINLRPKQMNTAFCESNYGFFKKCLSGLVYLLFFFNIPNQGSQMIVIMRKKANSSIDQEPSL